MSRINVRQLKQSAIEAAWIQWSSLGSFIDAERPATSIVDPEELLLISLTLRDEERRLWDVLASWAKSGSRLFSVQRAKNLLIRFPHSTRGRLAEFAWIANTNGRDFRWRSLAGPEPGPSFRDQELRKPYPDVWQSSALILRLRLGLGIGITPDLLGYLISLKGDWATARLIAKATDYSVYSIRRAANNVAGARLIESTRSKPVEYRARIDAWRDLLSLDGELPDWRFWHPVYAFVAHLISEAEGEEWDKLSPYLLSSRLRDLAETYRDAFTLNQIEVPDPEEFPGENYLFAFEGLISILGDWIRESA